MKYEYRCSECGYKFIVEEPIGTPESVKECPECGSRDTRKAISSSAMSCKCNSESCSLR